MVTTEKKKVNPFADHIKHCDRCCCNIACRVCSLRKTNLKKYFQHFYFCRANLGSGRGHPDKIHPYRQRHAVWGWSFNPCDLIYKKEKAEQSRSSHLDPCERSNRRGNISFSSWHCSCRISGLRRRNTVCVSTCVDGSGRRQYA